MNNEIQNLGNIWLNIFFFIAFDLFIDLTSKQIMLNDLIVNEKYLNSFFFVKNIDEVFVDNIWIFFQFSCVFWWWIVFSMYKIFQFIFLFGFRWWFNIHSISYSSSFESRSFKSADFKNNTSNVECILTFDDHNNW